MSIKVFPHILLSLLADQKTLRGQYRLARVDKKNGIVTDVHVRTFLSNGGETLPRREKAHKQDTGNSPSQGCQAGCCPTTSGGAAKQAAAMQLAPRKWCDLLRSNVQEVK